MTASLIAACLATVVRLCAWLPLPLARRLAGGLGTLSWMLGTRSASVTHINLARCFPHLDPGERTVLARRSLSQAAQLLAESGPLSLWPAERLRSLLINEQGRDLIAKCLERKRGLLILVPHFGNWEFFCYLLGDFNPMALYDPPRLESLEEHLLKSRQRFGVRLAPADRRGLRTVYKTLREGGVACLLPDQTPAPQAGVFAPFFGQPALTMTLAHRLVQKTGAPVLMASAVRVPKGFAVRYEPLGDNLAALTAAGFAKTLNRAVEAIVRRDPAQYQWAYKRFKKQPEGVPNPYPKRRKVRRADTPNKA